jgi:hypothetical protein
MIHEHQYLMPHCHRDTLTRKAGLQHLTPTFVKHIRDDTAELDVAILQEGKYCVNIDIRWHPGGATVGSTAEGRVISMTGCGEG